VIELCLETNEWLKKWYRYDEQKSVVEEAKVGVGDESRKSKTEGECLNKKNHDARSRFL